MSNIRFTMKDLDGTVMPYTSFVISTSTSANAASFTTNLNGEATVSLAAVSAPYYISKQDGTTEAVIAYKFFVPDSVTGLDAEMLFVDMGKISTDKDTKSIAALIEAKVVAVNARNEAFKLAQILGVINNIENSLENVTRVETSIDNLDRVFSSIDKVDRVFTSIDKLDRIYTSTDKIDRVHASINNVDTVYANISNIDIISTNIININKTATIDTNITNVANIDTDVIKVADIAVNVTKVASIDAAITKVADIDDDVVLLNTIAISYLGTSSTAPTNRIGGASIQVGDWYIDSSVTPHQIKVCSEITGGTPVFVFVKNMDAEAAKVAAEAARDSINTTGKVFTAVEGTAAGIAATTNGQQFAVLSDDNTTWVVYRNNAGAALAVGPGNYTKAYFDAVFANGFTAERTGYLYAWLDDSGTLIAGIKNDGTFWSKEFDITASATIAEDAFTLASAAEVAVSTVINGPTRSLYLHAFTDNSNTLLGGFLSNGELEVKGINHSELISKTPIAVSMATPINDIVLFGDSLTEGTGSTGGQDIATQLKALYSTNSDTRDVKGFGYGGQGIASILSRQGSLPTQVTFPVGASGFSEIPASGPVSVAVTNSPLQYADIAQSKSILGSVAGVAGTLTRTANTNNYTFTRDVSGSSVLVDTGVPFMPNTRDYRYWTTVCWIGTNNLGYDTPANIMSGIANYLSWQITTQKRRVVVMPAINCLITSPSITTQKANYAELLTLVKAAYPYEYIDTCAILQRNNNGSVEDLEDVANNLPPRSLLAADRYHLNNAGYGVIAAEIKRIFDQKGY